MNTHQDPARSTPVSTQRGAGDGSPGPSPANLPSDSPASSGPLSEAPQPHAAGDFSTPGLTRNQRKLYFIIRDYIAGHGCSPSFDEMKDAIGLRSKSGIHRLTQGLIDRGYLRKHGNKARSVELIYPEDRAEFQIANRIDAAQAMREMLSELQRIHDKASDTVPYKRVLADKLARWRRALSQ